MKTRRALHGVPDRPRRRHDTYRIPARWGTAVPAMALLGALWSGCERFEAVSVYPTMVYDDEQAQVYIYGHGFQDGTTASLAWIAHDGTAQTVPLENVEVLDAYTMRAVLPDVSGQIPHLVFPYHELVTLSDTYTPGLYACNPGEDATPEPLLWQEGSTGPYCDEEGNRLAYAPPSEADPMIPPGTGDSSVLDYSAWYDLLDYCTWFLSPDTSLDEEHLSLLVPDYGLGCFYPADQVDDQGKPSTYSYCPLELPTAEVDVVVTLPDGSRSEISRGLTLIDWSLDYYWNPRYGTRIKGFFDIDLEVAPDPFTAATISDTDNDGYADLVTVASDGTATILHGPTFDRTTTVSTGGAGSPVAVEIAPMDDTGPGLDWAMAETDGAGTGSGRIVVRFDVDPTSGDAALEAEVILDFEPQAMALADLNQDGLLDIIAGGVTEDGTYRITPVLQETRGAMAVSGSPLIEGDTPMDFAVGHLDANQAADVVVARRDTGTLSIWYSDGTGDFSSVLPINLEGEGVTGPIAMFRDTSTGALVPPRLVDLTGDGTVDIVVADQVDNRIVVYHEGDAGALGASQALPLDAGPSLLALSLADADGRPDILVARDTGDVSVITNQLPSHLTKLSTASVGYPVVAIFSHDFDGDGYADLATLDGAGGLITVLGNTNTSIGLYFYYTLAQCTL